jgi:hypothetical protein
MKDASFMSLEADGGIRIGAMPLVPTRVAAGES